MSYDLEQIRQDFPILQRQVYGRPLVYLDNGATTQKPRCVVEAMTEEYYNVNANVHRGVHFLSQKATDLHEQSRETVRRFLNANSVNEIIFTRGTTESMNLVASCFSEAFMQEGDEVIISTLEHHSNIVPWQLAQNRKGIKLKKLYRTLFVATIAVPQFVSLLIMSKMLDTGGGTLGSGGGIITQLIENLFGYHLQFGLDILTTRIGIILVNLWIGVPYSMLLCSGILMNIPEDLYESARMDGTGPVRRFMKITLPYMLFVTGPYLLTSFTGNINNFNVIFLLSQGKPLGLELAGNAGTTDLLITWLYKMTVTDSNYKLAAVMGILVFVVCAVINLVVYNFIPSVKNEEDFQ